MFCSTVQVCMYTHDSHKMYVSIFDRYCVYVVHVCTRVQWLHKSVGEWYLYLSSSPVSLIGSHRFLHSTRSTTVSVTASIQINFCLPL